MNSLIGVLVITLMAHVSSSAQGASVGTDPVSKVKEQKGKEE